MKVLDFLQENNRSLQALTDQFGIRINSYENYSVLNYSQVDSPKFHPIVGECRGLIIDTNNWVPLCRPMNRFFNFGEDPRTSSFPFSQSQVLEKLDGTQINIWWNPYLNIWNASTRSMAHAEGIVAQAKITFSTLVEIAKSGLINIEYPEHKLEKEFTYIFELTSPYNRVVKPYQETKLTLLTIKNNDTGEELLSQVPEVAQELDVSLPEKYPLKSMDDITRAVRELPALDEGYVCTVDKGNGKILRLKVKNPSYLAIAHMRDNGRINENKIIQLVMLGNEGEYLQYFPEDSHLVEPYSSARKQLLSNIKDNWESHKDIKNQKEFALAVKDKPYSGILFAMRKCNLSLQEAIEGLTEHAKTRLLLNILGEN